MLAGKVGVIENVITQPVRRNGIVDIVAFVCIPVLRQLFRAENKNGFVAVLIILNDRERSKSFAKTDAISKNTAVEFLKLTDDGENSVTLEVVKHPPDFAFLKARCFIGQLVLRNIIKELFEDVIERDKIDILRCVLTIRGGDILNHNIRDFLQLFLVIPELFKKSQKVVGVLKALSLLHWIIGVVAALTAKIDSGESIDRHIGAFIDRHEAHHLLLCDVRFENRLTSDPVRTLLGDRFLGQLIAEFYFKLSAIQTAFS